MKSENIQKANVAQRETASGSEPFDADMQKLGDCELSAVSGGRGGDCSGYFDCSESMAHSKKERGRFIASETSICGG